MDPLTWVMSPLGRKVSAVILLVLLLWYVKGKWEASIRRDEQQKTVQTVVDDQAKGVERAHDVATKQVSALQAQIETLKQQQATQQALFLALATQRQQVPQQISTLTEAQVAAAVAKALGRNESEAAKPLTVEENRKILGCFDELKLCDQQIKAKTAEVEQASEEKDKLRAQYDVVARLNTETYQAYVDLFNWKANPKRGWKCLGLWKCVRPRIAAPDPAKLLAPAAAP